MEVKLSAGNKSAARVPQDGAGCPNCQSLRLI